MRQRKFTIGAYKLANIRTVYSICFFLMLMNFIGQAQSTLIQVKCFDQQLKPFKNIEVSLNGMDFVKIGNKGEAILEVSNASLPVKTIEIKDPSLEPASWNYTKGVIEIIIRKRTHKHIVIVVVNDNKAVPNASVTLTGSKSYHIKADESGKAGLLLPIGETIKSVSQFSVTGHIVINYTVDHDQYWLEVDEIIQMPANAEVAQKPKEIKKQDYFKDFDLSKLDSIQSLTVFYSLFKDYEMKNLSAREKNKIDSKFYQLVKQLEDSVRNRSIKVVGRISDSSFVKDDVKSLVQQASVERTILDNQRVQFEERIEMINEKLSQGIENLDPETRSTLLTDLTRLEGLLTENENKFYRNLNDYRNVINSLKQKYFNLQELEDKLSESESRRLREQAEFRKKLAISILVAGVFAALVALLISFSLKLRKQKAELKHMNENLEVLVDERTADLKAAHKELDTFLYRASHDLRSPLCSIVGLCNLASHFAGPDAKDILDKAVYTTAHMDKLLKKLTIISEINAPTEYTTIQLVPLIESICHRLENVMHANSVLVKINLPDEPLEIRSYPNLIEAIVSNLLDNAVLYASLKDSKERLVSISLTIKENEAVITIYDNGIGIEDRMKDKIFHMFYKGNVNSKGNGLGLYIVQKSVQALKGTITVESTFGEFSKFIVAIPLEAEARELSIKPFESEIYELS